MIPDVIDESNSKKLCRGQAQGHIATQVIEKKMSPSITLKNGYVLIEPSEGTDFREIQRGVARLFYAEGIPAQNRIWVFHQGPENLSNDDLHKLKAVVKENYPDDTRITKTAIVVESELQRSLAETFAKIADDLPQTFKVFTNLADAEAWVREP